MIHKQMSGFFPAVCLVLTANLFFLAPSDLYGAQKSTISLVTDGRMGLASRHGANKVRLALQEKVYKPNRPHLSNQHRAIT